MYLPIIVTLRYEIDLLHATKLMTQIGDIQWAMLQPTSLIYITVVQQIFTMWENFATAILRPFENSIFVGAYNRMAKEGAATIIYETIHYMQRPNVVYTCPLCHNPCPVLYMIDFPRYCLYLTSSSWLLHSETSDYPSIWILWMVSIMKLALLAKDEISCCSIILYWARNSVNIQV